MTGTEGVERRWRPGEHILWRYRDHGAYDGPSGHDQHDERNGHGEAAGHDQRDGRNGHGGRAEQAGFLICRPATVVQDSADLLAVWIAPGTPCIKPVIADGTPLHEQPLATRYTAPRTVVRDHWRGTGVLKLVRPGEPWSVWLFWDEGWTFRSWYVNLEEPHTRWCGGIDSEDHFLDISVLPDRSWLWLDEDEFAEAQRAGLMDAEQAARVRRAGAAAVEVIKGWGPPFSDGWEHWRPDPAWHVPELPGDWGRTPARTAP
ncbi:cytidylyl-2-hydroxypropylphosphonate hydrolase [Streptomyces sp. NPDC003860]